MVNNTGGGGGCDLIAFDFELTLSEKFQINVIKQELIARIREMVETGPTAEGLDKAIEEIADLTASSVRLNYFLKKQLKFSSSSKF